MRTQTALTIAALALGITLSGAADAEDPTRGSTAEAEKERALAVALAEGGHWADAVTVLDDAVAHAPGWAELYYLRAGVHARAAAQSPANAAEELGRARQDLDAYRRLLPNAPDAAELDRWLKEREAALPHGPESGREVRFVPADAEGTWELVGEDGKTLCQLPCVHRVPDKSGMYLVPPDKGARLALPDVLEGSGPLVAVPRAARGSPARVPLAVGGAVLAIIGGVGVGALAGNPDAPGHDTLIVIDGVLGGIGVVMLAVAIPMLFYARPASLDLHPDPPRAGRLELGPSGVGVSF